MAEKRDPPIEPLDYISGITVVDIGDWRVSRGMTRRPHTGCHHSKITYDPRERRIWCQDCERDVEPFDAFVGLVDRYGAAVSNIKKRRDRLNEAERFQARSLAVKELDKIWMRRNYVPACPHCSHGLFPEDFKNGVAMLSRDYAEARRKKAKDD